MFWEAGHVGNLVFGLVHEASHKTKSVEFLHVKSDNIWPCECVS